MFIRDVLPQPLGPTTATNSPFATERLTSTRAGISRASRSNQYRLETRSISSFFIQPRLPQRLFGPVLLFGFDGWPKEFFEESFFYETVDRAVVDDCFQIHSLQCCGLFRVSLRRNRFHRGRQDIRYAFEGLVLGIQIVDAL